MELKYYLSIIRTRFWHLAIFIIVCCLATGLISHYFIKPSYKASADLIIVKPSSEDSEDKLNLETVRTNIELIETYKGIAGSLTIMNEIVKQLPELNMTATELRDKVVVSSIPDTQIMNIATQAPTYEQAAKIINVASSAFISKIEEIMNVNNVSILNAPDPQDPPGATPGIVHYLLISFVLSLVLGVGLIYMAEYLDDTIKTDKEAGNRLGIPVLGAVPEFKRKTVRSSGRHTKTRKAGEVSYAVINQET